MKTYMSPRSAAQTLGITVEHLRLMERAGDITCIRTSGGHRRYDVQSFIDAQTETDMATVGYCRVSGKGQADDLASQVRYVQSHSPDAEILQGFGSGINFKRKGLRTLWERLLRGDKLRVVLPIGIDSPASAEKSYNSWLNKTVAKSWFSTKLFTAPKQSLLPICSQFSMSFPAGCMASENTVIKSRKIEIFPTVAQKQTLRKWFGTSRYVYNQAVSLLSDKDTPTNFKKLVPVVFEHLPEWHVDTPRQIKVGAVMDACQAVRNAKLKCKQTGEFQEVKYRSKKRKQTLYLRADSLKKNGFYVRLLGDMKMAEPLPATPQGTGKVSERDTDAEVKDSQLILENGTYFLCVPYVEKKKPRQPSGRIVALDPGVRDFMTFFAEDSFGWLGQQCIHRIQRLCQHCDNLLSRATQEKRPLRRALRKAANKIKVKIRNLVDELHKKVAHFLVAHFDIILLPTFEQKQMTKRGARQLRKKSVRQMLTLSHYKFKAFLKQKALAYGVQVIDVCEAYTSKTVSWTGEIVVNLGGSKVIKSSEGHRMDRDLNGARGIFLKNVARALMVSPSTETVDANRAFL